MIMGISTAFCRRCEDLRGVMFGDEAVKKVVFAEGKLKTGRLSMM